MPTKTHQSSESSLRGKQNEGNASSICAHIHDPKAMLSEKSRRELEALAAKPDSEINFSDVPALTEAQLSEFVHGPWTALVERNVTLRLDDEVTEWLQQAGSEHAKRINLILKREAQRANVSLLRPRLP